MLIRPLLAHIWPCRATTPGRAIERWTRTSSITCCFKTEESDIGKNNSHRNTNCNQPKKGANEHPFGVNMFKSRDTDTYLPGRDKEIAVEDRVWTIPNALCVLRILAAPIVAYTVINNSIIESIVLLTIAGLTDFADGYIARRYESQRSILGGILDPLADKIMISTLFIATTISGLIPVAITSIVIGRDLFLIAGASWMRYQMLSEPKSWSSFFAFRGSSKMEVKSSILSKWNTTFQFSLVGFTLLGSLLNCSESLFLTSLQYLVAATSVASGCHYISNRNIYVSSLKKQ